ncbi:hypothetical protein B296_00032011 [Ensete ventricosum]|uniref:Uncharacterized protein n=1 Tax=Ensete ventricosum TaxID=4639 RepID=A0A426YIW1_ENSVE|nr:hypothetical protein B296_00032011 [Ensete ventricosum]
MPVYNCLWGYREEEKKNSTGRSDGGRWTATESHVETFPLGLSSTDASRETVKSHDYDLLWFVFPGKDTTFALSKLCVRLCLHSSGVIAAKFNYHPVLYWHIT